MNVYEIVTNKIIEQLEKGTIPWKKSWRGSKPINYVSRKPYRGVNTLLLPQGGEYLTFKQATEAGGKVKKGEKAHLVVFFKMVVSKKDEEKLLNGDTSVPTYPMLRYYNVFHISQCEGIETKLTDLHQDIDHLECAESVFKDYVAREKIALSLNDGGNSASYNPSLDRISIPIITQFDSTESYYGTAFHECAHSTGHKTRLNRDGITGAVAFGSKNYCKEELIAEIASTMILGELGIDTEQEVENSSAYIQGFLKPLKEDSKFIVKVSSEAQRAADMILNKEGIQ